MQRIQREENASQQGKAEPFISRHKTQSTLYHLQQLREDKQLKGTVEQYLTIIAPRQSLWP